MIARVRAATTRPLAAYLVSGEYAALDVDLAITDADGAPVRAASLEATVGRATHIADDISPDFRFDGGAYVAPVELAGGNWNIRINAVASDGTVFEQRVNLVKE